jgi:hypothetical protein
VDTPRDTTPDTEWLSAVGRRGWVAITHDERHPLQGQRAGCRPAAPRGDAGGGGSRAVPELAEHFVRTIARIEAFVDGRSPPYIAKVYRPTPKELGLRADAPGSVSLWYPKPR